MNSTIKNRKSSINGLWIYVAAILLAALGIWLMYIRQAWPSMPEKTLKSDKSHTRVNKPEDYLEQTNILREAVSQNPETQSRGQIRYKFAYSNEYPDCTLETKKIDDKFAIFTLGCEESDANMYLAKRMQEGWTVITSTGQERPYCNDMEFYEIPEEWYSGCITQGSEGFGTVRPGKLELSK